jgi:hypothetical protein
MASKTRTEPFSKYLFTYTLRWLCCALFCYLLENALDNFSWAEYLQGTSMMFVIFSLASLLQWLADRLSK